MVIGCGLTLAAAGCGGSGGTTNAVAVPAATPSPTPAPLSPVGLYVSDAASNSVLFFAANPAGGPYGVSLAGKITGGSTGLNAPDGIALDANGRIYVANAGPPASITVYPAIAAGTVNEAPIATISGNNTGLAQPTGVAVDASGRVYVSDAGTGNPGSISVFAANPSGTVNAAPIATIANAPYNGNTPPSPGLDSPQAVAVDSSGKIYVADAGGFVEVFAANPSGHSTAPPIATISGSNTTLSAPRGIAVDGAGNVYVSDIAAGPAGTGEVLQFAPPTGAANAAPVASFGFIINPVGVAVDGAGQIYVAENAGSRPPYPPVAPGVLFYAPGPSDDLLATFTGTTTGISGGDHVAVFSVGMNAALSVRRMKK